MLIQFLLFSIKHTELQQLLKVCNLFLHMCAFKCNISSLYTFIEQLTLKIHGFLCVLPIKSVLEMSSAFLL